MNKIKDFQRKRVYDWELSQSWMSKISYLTEQQVRSVIEKLDKVFKRKTKIKFKNGYGCSFAVGKSEIHLRKKWAMNYGVILHEYAHLLTKDIHGRQFVSAYCNLLNIFHPKQPSIDELCQTMYQFRVSHDCFDEWRRKHKLTRRHKPFEDVPETAIVEVEKPKKKRISAKQRCQMLTEEHDWLHIYHDDWIEGEIIIEVYDKTLVDEENMDRPEYWCYGWKEAKEEALELIEEHESQ
tara:strand:+ start:1514 stop:2227 length:714 start_codon:yes stop_codon:yes gene_type:complete